MTTSADSVILRERPPLFTVVLPTHNRPMFFRRALRSVLRQRFVDFELVVVDNSDDGYAPALLSGGPRFRCLKAPPGSGAGRARNVGIASARGRYIAFLDDDDEYLDTFLEATYQRLVNAPPGVGAAWSGVRYVDEAPEGTEGSREWTAEVPSTFLDRPSLFAAFLGVGVGCGVTLTADCLRRIGVFDPSLRAAEDTDLFFRLLTAGFLPVPVPGTQIVVHDHRGARSTGLAMHEVRISEARLFLDRYREFLRDFPVIRGRLEAKILWLESELARSRSSGSGRISEPK